MKSLNNGQDIAPVAHLFSPNETSSGGNELHVIVLSAKGIPRESLNNPGCWQGRNYRIISPN